MNYPIVISWKDLTINNMTNSYLYGQLNTPSDLQNENLIRSETNTPITLTDVASFMTEGPGRYANGAQFLLINMFMNGDIMPDNGEKQEELVENLNIPIPGLGDPRFSNITQSSYDVDDNMALILIPEPIYSGIPILPLPKVLSLL